jgi:hypothetical protein
MNPSAADLELTTLAGSSGASGYQDGVGTNARFSYPGGIAVHRSGAFAVVSDYTSISKVTREGAWSVFWASHASLQLSSGVVTRLAGGTEDGYRDGAASQARFDMLSDIALEYIDQGPSFAVLVADSINECIRRLTPAGICLLIRYFEVTMLLYAGVVETVANNQHFLGVAVDSRGTIFACSYQGGCSITGGIPFVSCFTELKVILFLLSRQGNRNNCAQWTWDVLPSTRNKTFLFLATPTAV